MGLHTPCNSKSEFELNLNNISISIQSLLSQTAELKNKQFCVGPLWHCKITALLTCCLLWETILLHWIDMLLRLALWIITLICFGWRLCAGLALMITCILACGAGLQQVKTALLVFCSHFLATVQIAFTEQQSSFSQHNVYDRAEPDTEYTVFTSFWCQMNTSDVTDLMFLALFTFKHLS